MFDETFLELLVIKNLNLNLLTKLQQYLGKYFNLSCLYIGHANRKWYSSSTRFEEQNLQSRCSLGILGYDQVQCSLPVMLRSRSVDYYSYNGDYNSRG